MDIKTMMLNKLKKELADNEENIKAAIWMIEANKAKLENAWWNESKLEVDSQIAFLQDRLIKHTNRRKEILKDIKKLEN
ncbi:hypothetical protein QTV32_002411 [Vibrio parahaemolyticus]|nr:hypothetical protein [Vibrio parahaemolyticus]